MVTEINLHAKPYEPGEEDIPNWMRSFKGCESLTDEEAREVYASLGILAELLIKTQPFTVRHIDNQHVVTSDSQQDKDNIKTAA